MLQAYGALRPHTLFYLDPSYGEIEGYGADFPLSEHERMADLFESILLAKTIPFSYVPSSAAPAETAKYEGFRRGVSDGAPFTQRFTDVQILVDGNLARVTLVFINTRAQRETWGLRNAATSQDGAGLENRERISHAPSVLKRRPIVRH